jgi:MoaA/NifB/PqqE/SkfB family radical SAM enzyme
MTEKDLSVPVLNDRINRNSPLPEQRFLPDVYRLPEGQKRTPDVQFYPSVIFIEVTNRCNLLCQTCPRTHFDREPLKSLTLDEFARIAEQFPNMRQAELHGIGEPLLNRHLPQIIRYLKDRGVRVVTNSNGTLLTEQWQKDLVESGLDDYRCSIDGAEPETYARIRGADLLDKLVRGLGGLVETRERLKADNPHISIWCVATRDNLVEMPELIRLAATIGVPEVYLQRMVYFAHEPEQQLGMAKKDLAIFGANGSEDEIKFQEQVISECERLSKALGVKFRASGARDPRNSLAAARAADFTPWQACMRPWTTAYVTANGNCLPCCISPFATHDYESLVMGNLLEQPFAEIWNNPLYQKWRADLLSVSPHKACAGCGVYWSL